MSPNDGPGQLNPTDTSAAAPTPATNQQEWSWNPTPHQNIGDGTFHFQDYKYWESAGNPQTRVGQTHTMPNVNTDPWGPHTRWKFDGASAYRDTEPRTLIYSDGTKVDPSQNVYESEHGLKFKNNGDGTYTRWDSKNNRPADGAQPETPMAFVRNGDGKTAPANWFGDQYSQRQDAKLPGYNMWHQPNTDYWTRLGRDGERMQINGPGKPPSFYDRNGNPINQGQYINALDPYNAATNSTDTSQDNKPPANAADPNHPNAELVSEPKVVFPDGTAQDVQDSTNDTMHRIWLALGGDQAPVGGKPPVAPDTPNTPTDNQGDAQTQADDRTNRQQQARDSLLGYDSLVQQILTDAAQNQDATKQAVQDMITGLNADLTSVADPSSAAGDQELRGKVANTLGQALKAVDDAVAQAKNTGDQMNAQDPSNSDPGTNSPSSPSDTGDDTSTLDSGTDPSDPGTLTGGDPPSVTPPTDTTGQPSSVDPALLAALNSMNNPANNPLSQLAGMNGLNGLGGMNGLGGLNGLGSPNNDLQGLLDSLKNPSPTTPQAVTPTTPDVTPAAVTPTTPDTSTPLTTSPDAVTPTTPDPSTNVDPTPAPTPAPAPAPDPTQQHQPAAPPPPPAKPAPDTSVKLPDGSTTHAPNGQAAQAARNALANPDSGAGDPATQAYSGTGVDLSSGKDLGESIDPSDLQPGDVIKFDDTTAVMVGPHQVATAHGQIEDLSQFMKDHQGNFDGFYRPTVAPDNSAGTDPNANLDPTSGNQPDHSSDPSGQQASPDAATSPNHTDTGSQPDPTNPSDTGTTPSDPGSQQPSDPSDAGGTDQSSDPSSTDSGDQTQSNTDTQDQNPNLSTTPQTQQSSLISPWQRLRNNTLTT